jgi:hypothetical protein
MSTPRLTLALAGALVLSACSSGGSGGGNDPDDLPPAETFSSITSDFDNLLATYDQNFPATQIVEMPATGTATYRGSALYSRIATAPDDIIANPSLASRVALTADFANSAVSGRLGDFRAADPNTQVSGALDIVDGQIVGNLFDGRVEGALTVNGAAADHTGGTIFGGFLGSRHQAVSGRILQGTSPTPYNGVFVGER